MSDEKKITFNGREVTEEEFKKLQENAEQQKNAEIVEVSKGEFKQRLQD